MTIVEKINAELQAFNAKKQELVENLRTEFPVLLAPLFEKSKMINSIGWTQYTPFFNDGEECTFSVHELNHVNGEYYDSYDDDNVVDENVVEQFQSVLSSVPDDFYRDLFGDHVLVTVHRDGRIEVEEYDHD